MGVDLVIFGLAAVNGFHIERMAQDKGNRFLSAEVGEPIPGEDTFNGHDKADEIEDFAQVFERALRDGGWA